jgi:hypothetical protein
LLLRVITVLPICCCLLFNTERQMSEGISFSFKKRTGAAAAAAADGEAESKDAASAEGPFAEAGAHAVNGADGGYVLHEATSLASTIADLSGSDWHM